MVDIHGLKLLKEDFRCPAFQILGGRKHQTGQGEECHRKSAATHPTLWTGKHAIKDGCSALSALLQLLRKDLCAGERRQWSSRRQTGSTVCGTYLSMSLPFIKASFRALYSIGTSGPAQESPCSEQQAQDRLHRSGHFKPVRSPAPMLPAPCVGKGTLPSRSSQSGLLCRWNPAVEQQAQDRIHRLGQYKPINVTRFIIAGTIEERILKLQVSRPFQYWVPAAENFLLASLA